MATKVSN